MTRNMPEAALDLPPGETEAPEAVLRVLGLEKTYRAGFWRQARPALAGISFVVPQGSVFALLGHNGAGKTTTMKSILDLVPIDAGVIELFGLDHRDRRTRSRVGYLPERVNFYEHLSARELLDFYGALFEMPARTRRRRVGEVLDLVGLERHASVKLRKYSKGMLQRLGIAQAILNEPEFLILDEPMSGLDPLGRRAVRDLLEEMKRRGTTILLSSHIVPDVEALADSVAILNQGQLQTVVDLSARSESRSFELTLSDLPRGEAARGAVGGCTQLPVAPGRSEVQILVPEVGLLGRLLEICHDHGTRVLALHTRQTGLEEIFLAALAETAPAGEEPGWRPDGARVPGGAEAHLEQQTGRGDAARCEVQREEDERC